MKKYFIFTILLFISLISTVYADEYKTGFVNCNATDNDPLYVRPEPGSLSYTTLLGCNKAVTILDDNAGSTVNCPKWYKIRYGASSEGYSCGSYIYYDYEINEEAYQVTYNDKAYVDCSSETITLNLRNGINGNVIGSLSCNQEMTILDENVGSNSMCSKWYKVNVNGTVGYACSEYTYRGTTTSVSSDEINRYREYLSNMGFSSSYIEPLLELHKLHPKWRFRLLNTKLDWNTVIDNESVLGRNLLYYTYSDGYRSLDSVSYNWETDTYYRHPTETNWWYASSDAIRYYMDPRNFMSERNIFMFEVLSYQPTYQTEILIRNLLDKSFMPTIYKNFYGEENMYNYAHDFVIAGDTYNVSPSHLASRIIQEGNNSSSVEYDGNTYTVFNFFNIRAYGSNPKRQGMLWAGSLGSNAGGTSYGRPWDTPLKSIMGGAQFLSEDYISIGQDTLYFQKFAVSVSSGRYTHQYMQNLTAPLTEGSKVYNAYNSVNSLNENITFILPVYLNMPSSAVMAPNGGNPNYYLKDIKINGESISLFKYNQLDYEIEVDIDTVEIIATTINSHATYNISGNTTLENGNNEFTITVTAENGNKKEYHLNIIKRSNETDVNLENDVKNIIIKDIDFVFNKDILEYNLEVSYEKEKILISYVMDNDEQIDREVNLLLGNNTITINNKYKINVKRLDPSVNYILNHIGIKYNLQYISGININTDINSLINNISNISNSYNTTIKNKDGNIKNSGVFATGDKVNIKNSLEEKNYEILIYGDINGDGKIDKLDALAILREFYNYANYNGVFKEASDINKDGKIDKLDVLAVLRDYYGYAKISQ